MTITVQRVALHKAGWKMRFTESRNGMITTVLIDGSELSQALLSGCREAELNFDLMAAFNEEQTRLSRKSECGTRNNGDVYAYDGGRRH